MSSTASPAPSPRVVGGALIAVSIAAGIGAGRLISLSSWAILAACVLTVATVGMGVGALWMLRPSWTAKTWPPVGPELAADVRARRNLRNLGILFLAPLPLGVAGLVWAIFDGSLRWERMLILVVVIIMYGFAGVWLLSASRSDARAAAQNHSHTQRPANRSNSQDGGNWTALGGPVTGVSIAAAIAPFPVALLLIPAQLLLIVDGIPWGIPIWIALVATGVGLGVIYLRRYRAPVEASPSRELIRVAGKTLSWSDVTRAELFAYPPWTGAPRTVILSIGDDSKLRGRIVLRRKENLELSEEDTDLALRVIDASAIELPRDKDDPRGRFSRQLHPNSLTKTEAAAVVARPPGMGDDLPIAGTS